MKHAAALGLDVDMQAVDKAKALLGKTRHKVKNIGALSWQEVPAFYATLAEPTVTHLALKLLILTGLRSAPIRFIREDHIDGDILTVPADLMKSRRDAVDDFRVPLSDEALAVISEARRLARDGYLFPSVRRGVISDATMSRLMQRRGMDAGDSALDCGRRPKKVSHTERQYEAKFRGRGARSPAWVQLADDHTCADRNRVPSLCQKRLVRGK